MKDILLTAAVISGFAGLTAGTVWLIYLVIHTVYINL